MTDETQGTTRRALMSAGVAAATLAVAVPMLASPASAAQAPAATGARRKEQGSGYFTLRDGTQLFYKDWGSG